MGNPTFLHRHISHEHQAAVTPRQHHAEAAETQRGEKPVNADRIATVSHIQCKMLPSSGQSTQIQLDVHTLKTKTSQC